MKTSLGYLEKLAKQEEITIELQRSLKGKRKGLVEKIKVIDNILVKPLKRS